MNESNLRKPTFAEREGAKSLPSQLKLREISPQLRAEVWRVLHRSLDTNTRYSQAHSRRKIYIWEGILSDAYVEIDHGMVDDFGTKPMQLMAYAKSFMAKRYELFLEFIEFCCRHNMVPSNLVTDLNKSFSRTGAAYFISNQTIVPVGSEDEVVATKAALDAIGNSQLTGAKAHFRAAAECLTAGDFAGSIRESIHAVESAARKLAGTAKTLGPALNKLETQGKIHPALKSGFSSLYGYTSDAEGIRHALLDGSSPAAQEKEALYMFGACAAFVSYLIRSEDELE